MMGSETRYSKIVGFLGTHGTRANGATATAKPKMALIVFSYSRSEVIERVFLFPSASTPDCCFCMRV